MSMGNKGSRKAGNTSDLDVICCAFDLDLLRLPDSVLLRILTFVPDGDLLNCMLVCKEWHAATQQATFWKIKCLRSGRLIEELVSIPAQEWRSVYFKNPYGRNLMKNPCGEEGVNSGWTILEDGGDRLCVETRDIGCKPKPPEMLAEMDNSTKNFATSYQWCSRVQVVDLIAEGCSEYVLDEIQPAIEVSEWFAARWDCGNTWTMRVTLSKKRSYSESELRAMESLDSWGQHYYRHGPPDESLKDDFVDQFQFGPETTPQWSDATWNKVQHIFTNYGPGVRSVIFEDGSSDTQYWAGHYGGKMSAATVKINLRR
ncbi:F-box only protein 44-like [Ptychodera flava]|uniref:F-box only protein 44-like n=1 Tax=Ptychodera flava TaxID=63121 RepID=UPI00396A07FB